MSCLKNTSLIKKVIRIYKKEDKHVHIAMKKKNKSYRKINKSYLQESHIWKYCIEVIDYEKKNGRFEKRKNWYIW